jgi:hypothetical protein
MDTCFSCGGEYQHINGPVHRYMASSPGCWAAYGEVLAREYSHPLYFSIHRLTVDAYAVQHPGSTDRQSIQSVGLHLIRLCLFLEYGLTAENANDAMLEAGKYKRTLTWLKPPASMGEITAADVFHATSVDEHKALVHAWAESSWNAWSRHHDTIRSWLPARQKAAASGYRRR